MPIEVSDEDAQSLGIEDKGALSTFLEKFETDRTKARQAVIDKKDGELRAFTDLGLTADEIKSLRDAAKNAPTDDDVEKRIKSAISENDAANRAKSDARARAAEVRAQAAELSFIKPAQALALLDQKKLSEVSVTDDGDADEAAVKKLLEEFAKENTHLLKPTNNTPHHREAGIGAAGSGNQPDVRPGADRLRNAYANNSK